MKKLCTFIVLGLFSLFSQAQNPDVLIDSAAVISPYWGLKFESGTVMDASMNCGSSNTNFVVGQPYLLARFPINLANMGSSVAYFGRYGQNGITHDPCYSPQFTNPTDFINIPNFVTSYWLDSCGNVITSNKKTDWNIQNNSQYAVSFYNGQTTYLTQIFNSPPTVGNAPNILKEWLESKCGPIDTNISFYGRSQMDAYYRDCQICDSLVLFPNYVSNDYGVLQLPTNLASGNYYLSISGNFYMLNQGTNCYTDSITFPVVYTVGSPVATILPTNHSCTQLLPPLSPSGLIATPNTVGGVTSTVNISWNADPYATSYIITPYLVINGNSEKAINSLAQTVNTNSCTFLGSDLRNAFEVSSIYNVDKKNLKFRFKVKCVNSVGTSNEVSTGNPAITVR